MRIVDLNAGYPIEAVLASVIRDAIRYRSAKIPAGCCSPARPCGEHVEDRDCTVAYEWLAGYLGITPAQDGMTSVNPSPNLTGGN